MYTLENDYFMGDGYYYESDVTFHMVKLRAIGTKVEQSKEGCWSVKFESESDASKFCHKAMQENIVNLCEYRRSYSNPSSYANFYLEYDDYATHKKVLYFLRDNGLLERDEYGAIINKMFYCSSKMEGHPDGICTDNMLDIFSGKVFYDR